MRHTVVRWVAGVVALAVLVGLGWWGIRTLSTGGKQGQLVMVTKPVARGDIEVTVRGWGVLQAIEERDILCLAEGVVKNVFVHQGDRVTKNAPIAEIEPGDLEIRLKQREIELEMLKIELAGAFGVSPDEVANVDPGQALMLKAPSSGKVQGFKIKEGEVASGVVCQIVDDSKLVLSLELPRVLFDMVRVGQEVGFRPERFDAEVAGVVVLADPTPIAKDQAYFYEVRVEIHNPGLLKVGDQGYLVIRTPGATVEQRATVSSYASSQPVIAAFSGTVKKTFVKEGSRVTAGEPLLEFETGQALLNAMARQMEYKQKVLELEEIKLMLQNLVIRAPIDGTVLSLGVVPSQRVAKGSSVGRVSNFEKMNLMLRLDEMDVPKVSRGQRVEVIVWGPQGQQKCEGNVADIGASGDPRDGIGAFNIRVELVNPGFLLPGMGAEASIFVSQKDDVLLCPVEALYRGEDGGWMVDVKEGRERRPVPVKVGLMNDMVFEVLDGLTEGQEVITGMTKEQPEQQGPTRPGVIRMIK